MATVIQALEHRAQELQQKASSTPKQFRHHHPGRHFFKPKSRLGKILACSFAVFFILTSPFLVLALNLGYVVRQLQDTQEHLQSADVDQAAVSAQNTRRALALARGQLKFYQPVSSLILGQYATSNLNQLVDFADQASTAVIDSTKALDSTTKIVQHALSGQPGNIKPVIATAQVAITASYHQISLVEATLKNSPELLTLTPFQIGEHLTKVQDYLANYRNYLDQSRELMDILPVLLGTDSKKTYLILLQNNAELRPTGGFIGSYALATFDQGALLDIQVEDVYTADGQLKGHVEPPAPIKRYLGEAGWFLRDSNWDPNFSISAARAAWFLDKELGQKVDGVIGVNLYAIQKLLEVTGPVNLPDYDETITAQNLFDRAQYQVEINQFPGSTQKKDFIGTLTNSLITTLINSPQQTWFQTSFKLAQLANQNQLTFWVDDQEIMRTLEDIGWSGELLGSTCPATLKSPTCYLDYLAVVDANVGVNKVNYFITRELTYHPIISSSGAITANLTIKLTNSSPDATWPGGTYHNYTRVYAPAGSSLQEITVGGIRLPDTDITTNIESGKTVFGFINLTPPLQTSTIEVKYRLPKAILPGSPTAYHLLVQKQPGTRADPLLISLTHPTNLTPVTKDQAVLTGKQRLSLNTHLEQNQTMTVEFARTL